jgi:hypothetical protein
MDHTLDQYRIAALHRRELARRGGMLHAAHLLTPANAVPPLERLVASTRVHAPPRLGA